MKFEQPAHFEKSESTPSEAEVTQRISEAKTLADVYKALEGAVVDKKTAQEVRDEIEQMYGQILLLARDSTIKKEQADDVLVALLNLPLKGFTRRYGLRDKLKELFIGEYHLISKEAGR